MKNIIEVRNLTKKYKQAKKAAVDDVSFEVKSGEFFTLLGPNGAGKTTTISILNTTLSKTTGNVVIAGKEIDEDPNFVRQNIGVIFQNQSLDMNLTAEENVRFHAVLYGMYPYRPFFNWMPQKYQKEVNDLAAILGIEGEMNKPIKSFSGGMKRKLEIVKGLIHRPKILFLDEPSTGLDPLSRKNLWQYLEEVRKTEEITLFLTTHYLEEAENSDHICIIDHGQIVSMGTPDQIKKDLVDEYLTLSTSDPSSLKSELDSMKLEYIENENFKIKVNNSRIQEILTKIKTKITNIKLHSPSLEEAYLEIINKQSRS